MTRRSIDIIEVGPRDGFQNLCDYMPADRKIGFIDDLVEAGVRHMQITSFVSPKAIPQMKDAREVAESCLTKYPELDLFALVPNFRGAQTAHDVGMKKVTNVISLSKSHNKANINRTHDESFSELERIMSSFPDMEVELDVATAFGCPFEGKYIDQTNLLTFLRRAWDLGIRTFDLCDTVGLADPGQVRGVMKAVRAEFPGARIEVHIHDTRGMGLVNTLAAIEEGADGVQSTLGGLGGCPFAPGASGNTSTEDLVYMLSQMGIETGISFEKILRAAKREFAEVNGIYSGHHIHIRTEE